MRTEPIQAEESWQDTGISGTGDCKGQDDLQNWKVGRFSPNGNQGVGRKMPQFPPFPTLAGLFSGEMSGLRPDQQEQQEKIK